MFWPSSSPNFFSRSRKSNPMEAIISQRLETTIHKCYCQKLHRLQRICNCYLTPASLPKTKKSNQENSLPTPPLSSARVSVGSSFHWEDRTNSWRILQTRKASVQTVSHIPHLSYTSAIWNSITDFSESRSKNQVSRFYFFLLTGLSFGSSTNNVPTSGKTAQRKGFTILSQNLALNVLQ